MPVLAGGQIFGHSLVVGLHGLLARSPTGGTDFTVLVRKLEGLDETKSFVNITADRKIVDSDLTQFALAVNDKKSSESQTLILL